MKLRFPAYSFILAGAFLIALGILFYGGIGAYGKNNMIASVGNKWIQEAGSGLVAPACGSSSADTTCSNASPLVTIHWTDDFSPGGGSYDACIRISPGSVINTSNMVIINAGNSTGGGAAQSYAWTGAAINTQYTYEVNLAPNGGTSGAGNCSNPTHGIIGDIGAGASAPAGSFTTPNCEIANQPPVANAKISACAEIADFCIQSFSDSVNVERGVPTNISLDAEGSSDPNGWADATNGVSGGGKCEWNSDLNQGAPSFEQTINNPASSGACNISLGTKTFNDAPGAYTYQVLKITDNKAAVSNIDTVTVNVLDNGFSCNSSNQCVFGGGGVSCLSNAGCPGGGGSGGCIGNCGGGGGGSNGGGGPGAPIAGSPSVSTLSSDTSFFCPSHQVQTSWNYSDPNSHPQTSFRLQLDDNPAFNSMLIDAYKDTADHLYIIPANVLAFGTKYYFRVAVKNSTGIWSDWSSSANFTTPADCLVPDFALNSSNSISVNVTGAGSGTSNTTNITITPFDQFNNPVTLSFNSISPALPGAVYDLNPATLPSNKYSSGSIFQVTVPGTTVPGNYIISIKGEGGGLTRTINVNLKVNSTSPVFREI